jgi:hypothetical protein
MINRRKQPFETLLLALIMVSGWFALVAQLRINLASKAAPLPEIIIRYFSYFTLLTNLIVAVVTTSVLLVPGSLVGRFASRYTTLTAVTAYIVIVGIVYNVVLRSIWNPTGLQKLVDELLHTIIPLLFLVHWILFSVKEKLPYKSMLPWLLYPLLYLIFILTRGSSSGFFPYPFVDLTRLTLVQVFMNSAGVAVAVIAVASILIYAGNRMVRKIFINQPLPSIRR